MQIIPQAEIEALAVRTYQADTTNPMYVFEGSFCIYKSQINLVRGYPQARTYKVFADGSHWVSVGLGMVVVPPQLICD